jgi:hydrogenase/urease accessory protein HupE
MRADAFKDCVRSTTMDRLIRSHMLAWSTVRLGRSWRLGLFTALLLSGADLYAHDPGLSTVQGVWTDTTLELVASFAPADAQQLLAADGRNAERLNAANFGTARASLEKIGPKLWELSVHGVSIPPQSIRVELQAADNVSFTLVFPRPPEAEKVALRARQLALLPPGHREFVIVTDRQNHPLVKKLLSVKDDMIEVPVVPAGSTDMNRGESSGSAPTFWGFVRLGIEHIWTGYDHLLFLFALLVVCRSFRSIVAIISCFTLAHSLTLALATLQIVNFSSRLTEPAIAASIVFVGLENLVRGGDEPRGRWALTFAFGLIHGFGFASVLRDLGVGQHGDSVVVPLFTFNLGVELGQIAVAAVVLPLIWYVRKSDRFVRVGVPALSAIVAAAGTYWLIERTILA